MILALLAPAFAADPPAADPDPAEIPAGREIRYRSIDHVDFTEGLGLEGEIVRPQGNLVGERRRAEFNPLIRLRTGWVSEMRASVDEIR